jgi:hypothetical protein
MCKVGDVREESYQGEFDWHAKFSMKADPKNRKNRIEAVV